MLPRVTKEEEGKETVKSDNVKKSLSLCQVGVNMGDEDVDKGQQTALETNFDRRKTETWQ